INNCVSRSRAETDQKSAYWAIVTMPSAQSIGFVQTEFSRKMGPDIGASNPGQQVLQQSGQGMDKSAAICSPSLNALEPRVLFRCCAENRAQLGESSEVGSVRSGSSTT
ncbi:MAG TPA: hypothetical protein VIJ63_23515, partial [Roseiarcus sp.]